MTTIQLKRGSKEKLNQYLGQEGELCVDTDSYGLRCFDGTTVGGYQIGVTDVIDAGIIPEPIDPMAITMTIGKSDDDTYCGYAVDFKDYNNFGSVSKIPYWIKSKGKTTGKFLLQYILDKSDGYSCFGVSLLEGEGFSIDEYSKNIDANCIETNKAVRNAFYYRLPGGTSSSYQYDFKSLIGQTVTLKFTPDPDGFVEVS